MLLVVKKAELESSASKFQLLGFAAVHHFYHYPESTRLRISQVGIAAFTVYFFMCLHRCLKQAHIHFVVSNV